MKELPGHYLGSLANYAADTPWDLEYSIALDTNGHYQFYSRNPDGVVRLRHSGTSGRSLAQFAVTNGFDVKELGQDLEYIDSGFSSDFESFMKRYDAKS